MQRKRTQPADPRDDLFAPGVYLTDGSSLFSVVGELPHEPSLRLVEDCNTLEILMVHIDGLRAPGVRRVHAMSELEDAEAHEPEPSLQEEAGTLGRHAAHR